MTGMELKLMEEAVREIEQAACGCTRVWGGRRQHLPMQRLPPFVYTPVCGGRRTRPSKHGLSSSSHARLWRAWRPVRLLARCRCGCTRACVGRRTPPPRPSRKRRLRHGPRPSYTPACSGQASGGLRSSKTRAAYQEAAAAPLPVSRRWCRPSRPRARRASTAPSSCRPSGPRPGSSRRPPHSSRRRASGGSRAATVAGARGLPWHRPPRPASSCCCPMSPPPPPRHAPRGHIRRMGQGVC